MLEERDGYILSGSRLGGPLHLPWDTAAPKTAGGHEWQLLAQLVLDDEQAQLIGKNEAGALMWLYDPTDPAWGTASGPRRDALLWTPETEFNWCGPRAAPAYAHLLVPDPHALAMRPDNGESQHRFGADLPFNGEDPRRRRGGCGWMHLWELHPTETLRLPRSATLHLFVARRDDGTVDITESWSHLSGSADPTS